jgi:DNA-binding MarR family transcriptional regulator
MSILHPTYYPLGKIFATLTKQYIGVVSEKLNKMDIERYWYVLILIADQKGNITQKQLGELLEHDKATVVRIVDYLSKHGYVERKQNANDRREYFVLLTFKAKKALPAIKKAFEEANNLALMDLSNQQLKAFKQYIDIVEQNMKSVPATSVNLKFKKIKK